MSLSPFSILFLFMMVTMIMMKAVVAVTVVTAAAAAVANLITWHMTLKDRAMPQD